MLNTKNDVELTPGPSDGANSLSFSPVADYLAASSWDGQVKFIIKGKFMINYLFIPFYYYTLLFFILFITIFTD